MSLRCEATEQGVLLSAGSMELSVLRALPEFLASIDGSGPEPNGSIHPPIETMTRPTASSNDW